jgi:hypothetical protein
MYSPKNNYIPEGCKHSPDGRLSPCLDIWVVWSVSEMSVVDGGRLAFSKLPLCVLILGTVLACMDWPDIP